VVELSPLLADSLIPFPLSGRIALADPLQANGQLCLVFLARASPARQHGAAVRACPRPRYCIDYSVGVAETSLGSDRLNPRRIPCKVIHSCWYHLVCDWRLNGFWGIGDMYLLVLEPGHDPGPRVK
jgi:hypothetical protein